MKLTKLTIQGLGIALVIFCLCISINTLYAFQQQSAEELFEAAIFKQDADGDLEGAINLFKEILSRFPDNKPIGAKSQLNIGLCYEKLGRQNIAKACQAYQKVVDNYPDQTEAAEAAEKKLALLLKTEAVPKEGGKEIRLQKIHGGPDTMPTSLSPDGRFISFINWNGGRLGAYEVETEKKRYLKTKGAWMTLTSFWSPDNKLLAYSAYNQENFWDLRVIDAEGSNQRVLYKDAKRGVIPTGWSPDGKFVSVCASSQLGLVSIEDGTLKVLKTMVRDFPDGAANTGFSPDGRYIAYDFPPKKGAYERDIFVIGKEGTEEIPLIRHPADDYFVAWTPDGKNILFVSDRLGSQDLWIIPVEDGNPGGTPTRIKTGIGNIYSLGFTKSGAFYYGISTGMRDIYWAELDFTKGNLSSPPKTISARHLGENLSPEWSPDGRFSAYVSKGHGLHSLRIRTLATGEEREISQPEVNILAGVSRGLQWSPDGRSLLTLGYDYENNLDAYIFDVNTGDMTLVKLPMEGEKLFNPVWSKDGKAFYYLDCSWKKKTTHIMAYNVQQKQAKLFTGEPGTSSRLDMSPDGQFLAYSNIGGKGNMVLRIMPTTGEEPRTVMEIPKGGETLAVNWMPDSQSILCYVNVRSNSSEKKQGERVNELWKVSINGAELQKIKIPEDFSFDELRIHPDGKQVVFTMQNVNYEIWRMENFLPEKIK